MKKKLLFISLLVAIAFSGMSQGMSETDFDCIMGEDGNKVCLRLPKDKDVKAILYCHQNMTEEVLFRSPRFSGKMDSLGVAMAFVQSGSQNWDISQGCQERFEKIINDLAETTGHQELREAKIIPFGHSAQATFPWNFAAWNPEKTLCVVSFHGDAPRTNLCGYGRENIEWGRTRNIDNIPGLMVEGEYEWWDARVRPALAFKMMYPDSRISFLCDAGKGHFDLCQETQDYIAKFIEKSLDNPGPKEGVFYSKWNEDGSESLNFHEQFWYHDREMVEMTQKRYRESYGKLKQFVSVEKDGVLVPYDTASHIKINLKIPGEEFTLKPVFVNENRDSLSDAHAKSEPRLTLISGPAIQTGDNSFKFDAAYVGNDPKRLWSGITLCVEADGDEKYKSAVQEINIQLTRDN
ncbi:MAG: hypothetical protein J1F43_04805 [Muribaculaceae bacterium]|nr:hypothetical protein [Muribaculaceae bacterium]